MKKYSWHGCPFNYSLAFSSVLGHIDTSRVYLEKTFYDLSNEGRPLMLRFTP